MIPAGLGLKATDACGARYTVMGYPVAEKRVVTLKAAASGLGVVPLV